MKRKTYKITTRHPNGYRDGEHEVTVTINQDGTRYVSGGWFGCSRDYKVDGDRGAVRMLLAENGMRLVEMKPA